jgi:bacteriorhodopsin
MVFYIPPSHVDKDRLMELVAKGGGAFTTQPGAPPEVFTLLSPQACDDLASGASHSHAAGGLTEALNAVDQRFVECSVEQQRLFDWRQFLVEAGKEARTLNCTSASGTYVMPDDGDPRSPKAPQPSQVPAPMLQSGTAASGCAVRARTGEVVSVSSPAKKWVMNQPMEPSCDGFHSTGSKKSAGLVMNLRQLLGMSEAQEEEDAPTNTGIHLSDFELERQVSGESDFKANIDETYPREGPPCSDENLQDGCQHEMSITSKEQDGDAALPNRRPSLTSSQSMDGSGRHRRNSKEALELLGGIVESRRQEILKKEERNKHSALHKLAHKAEWGGAIAFTLSSTVMLSLWARHEHEEAFVTTFFVTSIAAAAYLTKATIGDFILNGTKVPVARYLDWITTTPLMLYEVCHLGHAPTHTAMMIIGCDILMLGFGIVSALISWKRNGLKHVWFFMSSFFYILMLVTLQVDVARGSALDQPVTVQHLFQHLQVLTTCTWSCYPIVVLLGRAHFKVITRDMEDILLVILDVTAKIGMEGFIVATCSSGGCSVASDGDYDGGH